MGEKTRAFWMLVGVRKASAGAHETKLLNKLRPGDGIVLYLSDADAFAAAGEVGPKGALGFTTTCPKDDLEPAAPLAAQLEVAKDWPPGEWPKAPEGLARKISEKDFDQIRWACAARAKGEARPPGAPPNEAERPPKIPSRLKKPER